MRTIRQSLKTLYFCSARRDLQSLTPLRRVKPLPRLPGINLNWRWLIFPLPDGNGFTVCTEIKETQDVPVIFLTASGDEASVVTGLNMGADDYITKPFRPRELIARIGTALRKSGRSGSAFEIRGLYVDTASGIVKKNGSEVFLSALEYRLLLVFISNPKSIYHEGQAA